MTTVTMFNTFPAELEQGFFNIGSGGLVESQRIVLAFACAGRDTPSAASFTANYEWGSGYVPNWQYLRNPRIVLSGTKATFSADNARFYKYSGESADSEESKGLLDFTHGIIFAQTKTGSFGPGICFFPVTWDMRGSGYEEVAWNANGIFSVELVRP